MNFVASVLAAAAACVFLLALPVTPAALTVNDRVERELSFSSDVCESVTEAVTLPRGGRSVRPSAPDAGDQVDGPHGVVATITEVKVIRRWGRAHIRVTATPEPAACVDREEDAKNLRSLELRAMRLDRVARGLPESHDRRTLLESESARLDEVVRIALVRGAATVLEERAENAFRGHGTRAALTSAVVGILLLFALADYSAGQRDLIDLRAKCTKAEKEDARDACEPVLEPLTTAAKQDEASSKRKA